MSAILNLIGWPVALAALAIAASAAVRMLRHREMRRGRGNWAAPLMFGCAAIAALTVLGVLPVIAGAVTGVLMLAALVLLVRPWTAKGRGMALTHARAGGRWLGEDTRGIWGWLRGRAGRKDRGGKDGPVPLEAVAEYAATRAIPSVMEDPLLGPATEPGEIAAAGIPVPPPYAALATFIGGFEPEDDQALRMFMEGHASGTVVIADAWHAFADHCLNGAGLSPAYVAGILEAGNSAGEHASLLAQVHKRFGVVYAAVKEWIAAHGPLPHKAREFLTGED